MKKFERFKYFILGMIVMAFMTTAVAPALAASTTKQISAVFSNIKIYVDDVLIQPKDAQGNAIEPFIYNGTTYLPVRAVSEALGQAVTWDGKTSSVYIGQHDSETPAVMLHQLDYFTQTGTWKGWNSPKDNLGNIYNKGLTGTGTRDYILNGKYSRITGKYILLYGYRASSNAEGSLKIYGDDKLLYSYNEMKPGVKPVEFDLDLRGVLTLRIEMDNYCYSNVGLYEYAAGVVDVGLYQ